MTTYIHAYIPHTHKTYIPSLSYPQKLSKRSNYLKFECIVGLLIEDQQSSTEPLLFSKLCLYLLNSPLMLISIHHRCERLHIEDMFIAGKV